MNSLMYLNSIYDNMIDDVIYIKDATFLETIKK